MSIAKFRESVKKTMRKVTGKADSYEYSNSLPKDRTANSTSQIRQTPTRAEDDAAGKRLTKKISDLRAKRRNTPIKWGVK